MFQATTFAAFFALTQAINLADSQSFQLSAGLQIPIQITVGQADFRQVVEQQLAPIPLPPQPEPVPAPVID